MRRGRLHLFPVGVLVAAALVAGCSDDDGDGGVRVTERTTTTTARSTSTTTPSSTPTTEVRFPTDAAAYTGELVRAWGRGDRNAAGRYAVAEVVDELFRYADPGGSRWDLTEPCEGAAGTTYCSYEDPADGAAVLLGIPVANGNTIDGPQEVVAVVFPGPGG